ncbi:hypothetical protein FKM82_025831 [Ascaphus truei]
MPCVSCPELSGTPRHPPTSRGYWGNRVTRQRPGAGKQPPLPTWNAELLDFRVASGIDWCCLSASPLPGWGKGVGNTAID